MEKYRVGRKVGRTVYRLAEPVKGVASDRDVFLGIFDDGDFAAHVVKILNAVEVVPADDPRLNEE